MQANVSDFIAPMAHGKSEKLLEEIKGPMFFCVFAVKLGDHVAFLVFN